MNQKNFSPSESISFGWNTFKTNWKFWIIVFAIAFLSGVGSGGYKANTNLGNKSTVSNSSNVNINSLFNENFDYTKESPKTVLGESSERSTTKKSALGSAGVIGGIAVLGLFGVIVVLAMIIFTGISVAAKIILDMGYVNVLIDSARGNPVKYKTLLNQVSVRKAWRFIVASFLVGVIVFFGFLLLIFPGIYFAIKYMFFGYFIVDKDVGIRESLKLSAELTKGVKMSLFGFMLLSILIGIAGLLFFFVGIVPAAIVISLAKAHIFVKLQSQMNNQNTDQIQAPPVQPQPQPIQEPVSLNAAV